MLMTFKILTMLWPFIREMIFGKKSATQILKEHKTWIVVFMVVAFLLSTDLFLTKRLVGISQDYIVLEKKYKELASSRKIPVADGKPVSQAVKTLPTPEPTTAVLPQATVVKRAASTHSTARYQRLQKSLSDMQRDDDKNNPAN